MSSVKATCPQQVCEDFLREAKRYNGENGILSSESAIADRLLHRGIEMKHVYEELHSKLQAHPPALQVFLGLILSSAAFWNPEEIQKARTARDDLASANRQIARKAAELAALLERRYELHNTSGFWSGTYYHVCDVIEAASQHNHLFKSYVSDHLATLKGQFDLRYWPSLSAFVQALGLDAENGSIAATDPLTAAATAAARPSRADFFKALFAAIEENSAESYGQLPRNFKLTDRALASLGSCALGLDPDDMVDDAYIKRFRQRERKGGK